MVDIRLHALFGYLADFIRQLQRRYALNQLSTLFRRSMREEPTIDGSINM